MKPVDERWFKTALDRRNLTQAEVARRLGVDRSQVSLLFRGKRPVRLPDIESLSGILGMPKAAVINAFGLPIEKLGETSVPLRFEVDANLRVDRRLDGDETVIVRGEYAIDAIAIRAAWSESIFSGSIFIAQPDETGETVPTDCIGRMSFVNGAMICVPRRRTGPGLQKFDITCANGDREVVNIQSAIPVVHVIP